MDLRKFVRLAALPAFVLTLGLVLIGILKDMVKAPDPVGVTPEITLLDAVDAHRARIIENGTSAFALQCLERFPYAFKRAEELVVGTEQALTLGIAGYESAGCTQPKDGPGNVMHVTLPDTRHIKEAASLLGVPQKSLDWHKFTEHSVVLGAVMLQDYTKRTGSLATGLSAYRHGPGEASYAQTGDAYTRTALAHILLARRHFLSEEADYSFPPESSVDPMELPSAWWLVAKPPRQFNDSVALR